MANTGKVSDYFEKRTRPNGDTFRALKIDAPEWVLEMVTTAHQGTMPNDWVYEVVYDATYDIDHGNLSDEDSVYQWAESRASVYTQELYLWAAKFCLQDSFIAAEEDVKDLDPEGYRAFSTSDRLQLIQAAVIRSIAHTVLNAIGRNT